MIQRIKNIRAVIFDAGGVIVRTEERAPRDQLAARLGLPRDELNRLVFDSESAQLATVGKMTTQAHWEVTRQALNLSEEAFAAVPEDFFGGDIIDMELVNYIRGLRSHYRTALLSNAWDNLRQALESRWKIADAFDVLIISAEVRLAKPDPEIYRVTLDRLGVAANEAIFVDDFLRNIEAAQAVGIHAVQFRNIEQALADVEQILNDESSRPDPSPDHLRVPA